MELQRGLEGRFFEVGFGMDCAVWEERQHLETAAEVNLLFTVVVLCQRLKEDPSGTQGAEAGNKGCESVKDFHVQSAVR